MFETSLTVVGHIVNDLQRRKVGDQDLIKFRVASNSRRRTSDGGWEPGNSLFITVNCWGRLVTGVGATLGKGSPVIVVGHVYTSEYDDKDGNRRSSVEMRATSVGPDLSRLRVETPGRTAEDVARLATAEVGASDSDLVSANAAGLDGNAAGLELPADTQTRSPLPLSA
ncbi:single-stranded DNA-binding protein [Mycobacterium vicinigordonae]|uniref:Single-stranded DNA-binding protein n=1 Tax=Mycobacterium vicinigordonae TaxID=1719132 RepID=A0A7D6I3B8_9MYCO|nr:single-stranded DNA-binding protein [Mycobacterium vicinigordonae]QLL05918.1 single-stranded DNA-binding protein [Mycobacterium vicinigordonae]